ncbi:MAG: FKBP-type peptidyl-prolyl cis-trans isomerase [Sphingobacteriaceae bacterium]|nr:FKBP-type peptidyl-prolyl cis-trans isomerase [Sphingobacteriaceae bacterium]
MKKIYSILAVTSALSLIFSGCTNSSDSQFEGYTRAENGLLYKYFNHTEGENPQIGDNLSLNYQFRLISNDSVLMESKNGTQNGSAFAEINLQRSTFVGSLEDGLLMLCKGDSASFIVPADSFFRKTMGMGELPNFVKAGDFIKANMKVGEIIPQKMMEERRQKQMAEREAKMKEMSALEQPALDKYLADNKITTKANESGLIFVSQKKGSGANAKAGDMVEVNYTGTLLDGTVFDTSIESTAKANNLYNPQRPYEPIKFQLGVGQVIPGWDEGIALLNKGAKAKFIIPSKIGYGENAAGTIPPFSTLVFEVELVNFSAGPPPQPQGGQAPTGHEGHKH